MKIVFDNFWLAFIVVTVLNAYIFKYRSRKYVAENPELESGYKKIFKAVLIYGNVPWIIMGIGNLTELTNSMLDFFRPRTLNPTVLVFHISIICLWILMARWVFFQNGAEFLAKHPGLIAFRGFGNSGDITSPATIKLFFILTLLGGAAGLTMMWVMDIPVIHH